MTFPAFSSRSGEVVGEGAADDGLTTRIVSLCVDDLLGGRAWLTTDGEADAARSCSSRLGALMMGDGDDLGKICCEGLVGAWNGKVDGSGGCWCVLSVGKGSVASLKRRPLHRKACQWNGRTTTATCRAGRVICSSCTAIMVSLLCQIIFLEVDAFVVVGWCRLVLKVFGAQLACRRDRGGVLVKRPQRSQTPRFTLPTNKSAPQHGKSMKRCASNVA